MIISLVFMGLVFTIQWWAGILASVIGFLVFRPLVRQVPGSLTLLADKQNKRLELNDRSTSLNFDEIQSVYLHSKFVDEYASAFKSTSEEHQITIGFEDQKGNQTSSFKMVSDHAMPSKEMNEVHDFLQNLLGSKADLLSKSLSDNKRKTGIPEIFELILTKDKSQNIRVFKPNHT